jgi:hypothetical protein
MAGIVGALEDAVLETPQSNLARDEIEMELIKFGSFCSIIYNKKLNSVTIFSLIVKNNVFSKIFMNLTETDSKREAILLYLKYNSNLCRSKVVKEILKSQLK